MFCEQNMFCSLTAAVLQGLMNRRDLQSQQYPPVLLKMTQQVQVASLKQIQQCLNTAQSSQMEVFLDVL